jgi:GH15 family glucan-1,4-alpha-glucosidase
MSRPLEDYALIGDTQTAALVARDGAIDWLCAPRFDSDACLAALLGDARHGRWSIAPREPVRAVRRAYRDGTLVLETELDTDHGGTLRLTDCMPVRDRDVNVVRVATAARGEVAVRVELTPRFGYGQARPWIRLDGRSGTALSGPESIRLRGPVPLRVGDGGLIAELTLHAGERAAFVLTWHPSWQPPDPEVDALAAVEDTARRWRAWSESCCHEGPWREAVVRSLVTLKALTYAPTGGIVAAPTTSLPERPGGTRNWDYRFCWLRDASFTLDALLATGFKEEAEAWRDWLLRAIAGDPDAMQNVYGPTGERRLTELELPWLPGYAEARPVRIGNRASEQFQLDVYGEIMDCLYQAREVGIHSDGEAWRVERALVAHLETVWRQPDQGIWEIRGPRRHLTHSKVMAWVALDRAVKNVERHGLDGPAAQWARLRDTIHAEVCQEAWSAGRNSFVQAYGAREVDASLLLLPIVGFLPASDPRIAGTVAAVERDLLDGGLVRRYRNTPDLDGLPPGEGVFLPCSFWLADCYALLGRTAEARALLERLLALRNDVGLLAEEYDPRARRQLGNFPQAFSHVALINTARRLAGEPSRTP